MTLTIRIALISMSFLISCSHIEVNDATIKIRSYKESDRGKFWQVCIDYNNIGFLEDPIAYFEIHSKDNRIEEYSIDFIHLKQKCNDINVLVSFLDRNSQHEEWEWLRELDPENINYINVKIKRAWNENKYIYDEQIYSKDLK